MSNTATHGSSSKRRSTRPPTNPQGLTASDLAHINLNKHAHPPTSSSSSIKQWMAEGASGRQRPRYDSNYNSNMPQGNYSTYAAYQNGAYEHAHQSGDASRSSSGDYSGIGAWDAQQYNYGAFVLEDGQSASQP